MIIKEKKKREPLAYLFTILFFINYFLVFQQAQWLHKIDTAVYFKLTRNLNNLQVMFYNVISELSSSRMAIVYTIVLLGILWFIRWQIPGVWITFTVGTGLVVGWVARLILRYGSKRVEPEILVAIVYIIFLPYFKDKALAYLVGFILGIWLIATSVACIYLGQLHVSDITGALTLGFAWVYYCSNLYIRYAAKLKKIKGFRNSNY